MREALAEFAFGAQNAVEEVPTPNLSAIDGTAVGIQRSTFEARSIERTRNGWSTRRAGYAIPPVLDTPITRRTAEHTDLMG